MISLELAKQSKDAGLKWEPKFGDIYYDTEENDKAVITRVGNGIVFGNPIWLPSLSDILTEMEKRGYIVDLEHIVASSTHYVCQLWEQLKSSAWNPTFNSVGNTREEATGKALLWVLEKEKEGVNA